MLSLGQVTLVRGGIGLGDSLRPYVGFLKKRLPLREGLNQQYNTSCLLLYIFKSSQVCEVRTVIIPVLQVGKLSLGT